jgi:hypothetical protein
VLLLLRVSPLRLEPSRAGLARLCQSRQLCVVYFCLLGLPLMMTGCGTRSPGSQGSLGDSADTTPVQIRGHHAPVPQYLRTSFSLFRAAPTGTPHHLMATFRQPQDLAWDQARRLAGTPDRIWAVPMDRQLCLVEQGSQGSVTRTCTSGANAISHGLFTASLIDPSIPALGYRRTVVGIVPDRVSKVEVRTPGAPRVRVPVRHGTFVLQDDATAAPGRIRLVD